MIFKHITNNKGATIIELLIVLIIIISIFSITLVADFPRAKMNIALSQAAYTFGQYTRKAQLMALSDPQYKNSQGAMQPVGGYGVYIDMARPTQYALYADAIPVNMHYDGPLTDIVVESIDFSSTQPGIIIKEINNIVGNSTSINFSGPSPKTTINPTPLKEHIEVVFALASEPSKTKTVSINTAGLIEVK